MKIIARMRPQKGQAQALGVYLPEARDILLGKVPQSHVSVDHETGQMLRMYSLSGFLELLQKGDEEVRSLLLAPNDLFVFREPEWQAVQNNTDRLLGTSREELAQVCADRIQVTFYKSAVLCTEREKVCG